MIGHRVPVSARDFRTDAALRPQPRRDGPDRWATPPCLVRALVEDVLPQLPPGRVWEPACGAGDWRRPCVPPGARWSVATPGTACRARYGWIS